eukprot:EG_transcript_7102
MFPTFKASLLAIVGMAVIYVLFSGPASQSGEVCERDQCQRPSFSSLSAESIPKEFSPVVFAPNATPSLPALPVRLGICGSAAQRYYSPWNISRHPIPHWFHAAKLGIFIHWGLYSVPGWAVNHYTFGDNVDHVTQMTHTPYSEWYSNTMQLKGSPTMVYHNKTYGSLPYLGFVPMFNQMIQAWDPHSWANLFRHAGAKYVVLTSKHHDGFTLWPSKVTNPHRPTSQQCASRDIVGELTDAVRQAGLEMGLYYSGGYDWSFDGVIHPRFLRPLMPSNESYARYCDAHLRELIQRYRPAVLWNDIDYPPSSKPDRLLRIFIEYFNVYCPLGVVNKRWGLSRRSYCGDFSTPEYGRVSAVLAYKWELCRGVGKSFGYNRNEGPKQMMTGAELISLLVDVVAKNGNLLLDVGPDASGAISELQQKPLRELGDWMAVNSAAIHGTRPFLHSNTVPKTNVRYTVGANRLYCIIADKVSEAGQVFLRASLQLGTEVVLLQTSEQVSWTTHESGRGVVLVLPSRPALMPFVAVMQHPNFTLSQAVRVLVP